MAKLSYLGGLGLGALLMFFLDPDRGKRRRARARDQSVHWMRKANDTMSAATRDLQNRVNGAVAEMGASFSPEEPDDVVLAERVRAKLGRYVSHPHAVDVFVHEGAVTLSGEMLAHEVTPLMLALQRIPGVLSVENRLDVHHRSETPALQGGRMRPGEVLEVSQNQWSPGVRMLMSFLGSFMLFGNARRPRPFNLLLGAAGGWMVLRSFVNRPVLGVLREGVLIQKTLIIQAPIDRVFDFWAHLPEHYLGYTANIRKLRILGEDRAHWEVTGPMGLRMRGDALLTEAVLNERISWKSLENSTVRNRGTVHFEATEDGTRIHIQMTYYPPLGALGHWLATLFGVDPKSRLDEEMVRMKSMIETGKQPNAPMIVID